MARRPDELSAEFPLQSTGLPSCVATAVLHSSKKAEREALGTLTADLAPPPKIPDRSRPRAFDRRRPNRSSADLCSLSSIGRK